MATKKPPRKKRKTVAQKKAAANKRKPAGQKRGTNKKRATKRTPKETAAKQLETAATKPLSERTTDDLAAQFADVTDEQDKLKGFIAKNLAMLRTLAEVIKERFIDQQMQSINVHGRIVYLHRQLWAKKAQARGPSDEPLCDPKGNPIPIATEEVVEALRECGAPWDELCYETFNIGSLSAIIRDEDNCARNDDDMPVLPPELDNIVQVAEELSIKARKA